MSRRALVVAGGWEGHEPQSQVARIVPFLTTAGYDVLRTDTTSVYADADTMSKIDLVVQYWTMGTIGDVEISGLASAVEAGTGLAGWHGGIVDSFRSRAEYLQLTGGQFTAHPGGVVDYEVEVARDRRSHPIVAGIERFSVRTEQYWVLTDDLDDELAHTTITSAPGTPWARDVRVPVIWTRQWGLGRVFVSTIGHTAQDLDVPDVRTTIERGLLWASR